MTVDDLTQESIKKVEAGAAAHQAVVDLAEHRRQKLEDTEKELKLVTMEVDRLRIDVHDLKGRLAATIMENQKLEAARTAYETLTVLIARQLTEFVPPVPPAYAHRHREVLGDGWDNPPDPAPGTLDTRPGRVPRGNGN